MKNENKDQGAAVRGEAVAEIPGDETIWAAYLAILSRVEYFGKDDALANAREVFRAAAPASPRAADAPSEPLDDQRIVDLYRESFNSMIGRLREAPKHVPDTVLAFARAIEAEVLKSRAADALDSQPTDFEDRPLKARVLRNELAIILGCDDGRTSEQKADAVLRWIETQGQHVYVPAASQPAGSEKA